MARHALRTSRQLAGSLAGHPAGPHRPELLVGPASHVQHGASCQLGAGRRGGGLPFVGQGNRGLGGGVHDDGQQIGARDPVDHRVMGLGEHRPVAVLQALDHPHLP